MSSTPTKSTETAFRDHLAYIRHDLKTPVCHIMGYAEMLEEEVEDELQEILHDLRSIKSSDERLLELINDHLGMGKQNEEQIDLGLASLQMRQQLTQVGGYCEMVEELTQETGHTELTPDLDRMHSAVSTLTELIEQLLIPGSMTLLARGPGTDKTSVEDTTLDTPPGSIRSELGEEGELLVVDDDPANLNLLQRRLELQGYQVTVANGGKQALDLISNQSFDLLILDMIMPEVTGVQILRRVKSDPELKPIPVIMISALDDTERVAECIALGAEDYVFKPFNPVLLKARVSVALEKYRLRQHQAKNLDNEDRRRLSGSVQRIVQKGEIGKDVLLSQIEEILSRAESHETST